MANTNSAAHVRVIEETPAYWKVVFDYPPFNIVDASIFEALQDLLARMDASPSPRVVSNETATSKLAGPRYSARCLRPSHRVAMRSLAELANLLATPSGFWKRELLGAKPIAVCPLRDPSRTARDP